MHRDAAVLAADRRRHLASDFPTDHVSGSEYVRHVRAQEFIHEHLAVFADCDPGFFDRDLVGVGLTAGAD